MEDKSELFLESASGFAMPFMPAGPQQEVTLGFGEQRHPATGVLFNHQGIDLVCDHLPLLAVATGSVVGAGNDGIHGNYVVIRYGEYDVKYGHLSACYVRYGQGVRAGQQVAVSGDFLHLGVSVRGEYIEPMSFLAMVFSNMEILKSLGVTNTAELVPDIAVSNGFDGEQEEVLEMMTRWLPQYFMELLKGTYRTSEQTESRLRNLFAGGADDHLYFDAVPSMVNPLGFSSRSAGLIGGVQEQIIGDFLSFMAVRYGMYVPSWDDAKKKPLTTLFMQPG